MPYQKGFSKISHKNGYSIQLRGVVYPIKKEILNDDFFLML